jgi:hypothetical protein
MRRVAGRERRNGMLWDGIGGWDTDVEFDFSTPMD